MDYGLKDESIICFAGEDWWYHHPHSKNHILKRFARNNKVLFVNSISMGLPSVSNPDFFLKVRRKLKSYTRWLRSVSAGMWVMTPIIVPLYGSRVIRTINSALMAVQMRLAMAICGMKSPIVWVAIPSAVDIIQQLHPKLVMYQVSDKYDANEDSALGKEKIRRFDERLKRMAALVVYSGRKLFEEATESNKYYLPQGVDFERFAELPAKPAEEIATLKGPVLGYFGAMDYVMDQQLMKEVLRRRPEWQWVMLGLKSNLIRVAAPNLHFLGSRPYTELPSYISKFDVCILPWSQHNRFTAYGSAIKVREYLATGKPIVMTPLYEYLNVPGIRFFKTADEFISAVEDALANDNSEARELRRRQVRNGTWDHRTAQLGHLLSAALHRLPIRADIEQPLQPEAIEDAAMTR